MWCRLRPRPSVSVPPSLVRRVLAAAQEHAPLETGGVLLGYARSRGPELFVSELIDAGPQAKRERSRFAPDGPWQRAQIAERYEDSGRRLRYLGDWHSHPGGNGPSALDRETARKIAKTRSARCPHPLFLIATRGDLEWHLHAYRLRGRRLRRIALTTGS